MNIPEIGEKIKEYLKSDRAFYAGLLAAVFILAFGLGRLSSGLSASVLTAVEKPAIFVQKPTPQTSENRAASSSTILVAPASDDASIDDAVVVTPSGNSRSEQSASSGAYVASKKSDKYHLPWCSGAKRISDENKVWFATKEEAEKAGYEPAGNCPGI